MCRKCRYCKKEIDSHKKCKGNVLVCDSKDCIKIYKSACAKILPCGHYCSGVRDETTCLPCLSEECTKKNPEKTFGQSENSFCPICYSCGLSDMPSVMLDCGHIMHEQCLLTKLKKRWPGPRITFFFVECPSCRKTVSVREHKVINNELAKIKSIYEDVKSKARQRWNIEGIEKERILNPKDKYYNNPDELALAKLSFYQCYKCNSAYFGGLKNCENDNDGINKYKPSELICGKCSSNESGPGNKLCKLHGADFIEFKCKFCCSIAQWFCWGTTHFCDKCHTRQNKGDYISRYPQSKLPKCPGEEGCPLRLIHPPNGNEFTIGCALCRKK